MPSLAIVYPPRYHLLESLLLCMPDASYVISNSLRLFFILYHNYARRCLRRLFFTDASLSSSCSSFVLCARLLISAAVTNNSSVFSLLSFFVSLKNAPLWNRKTMRKSHNNNSNSLSLSLSPSSISHMNCLIKYNAWDCGSTRKIRFIRRRKRRGDEQFHRMFTRCIRRRGCSSTAHMIWTMASSMSSHRNRGSRGGNRGCIRTQTRVIIGIEPKFLLVTNDPNDHHGTWNSDEQNESDHY